MTWLTRPADPGVIADLPTPAGVLFDAGGTLLQLDRARLGAGLRARGVGHGDLGAAFWRAALTLDGEFSPAAGAFEGWWPRWQARLAEAAGVPAGVFREVYDALDAELLLWSEPAPGASEALARLGDAGVPIGVVSNADGRIASALEHAGLARYCSVIVDSGLVGVHKPDPAIFDHALGPLGLEPARTWYVGDTVAYDAASADAAGLVSWVIDHSGGHTVPHPRRVRSLAAFADAVLAARPW